LLAGAISFLRVKAGGGGENRWLDRVPYPCAYFVEISASQEHTRNKFLRPPREAEKDLLRGKFGGCDKCHLARMWF
jgi:hypothetical protein